jgi:hypothetical protein
VKEITEAGECKIGKGSEGDAVGGGEAVDEMAERVGRDPELGEHEQSPRKRMVCIICIPLESSLRGAFGQAHTLMHDRLNSIDCFPAASSPASVPPRYPRRASVIQ